MTGYSSFQGTCLFDLRSLGLCIMVACVHHTSKVYVSLSLNLSANVTSYGEIVVIHDFR